ncbi:uncharacterized protein Z520_06021 [Fonsecaea multimorphosa CBS 102226]|uniref:C2H2-type domain-containing protein n=1 Tax=Fonsecaea multimorphosa CBS 102226 TaxID=1442371 RepID=A0A0D2KMQ6_9EURO|nr:uncharacterized protein Z520_06021 [Fonsecaea multimorphosa CBS 102226]KIX97943.1 hypothetical protein Z520_06021 [Fonsecaea multimorphosa CBS 102226]OAL24316.1 hypothetical protein AYO22_05692 [Fonsecaea multimorphosa]
MNTVRSPQEPNIEHTRGIIVIARKSSRVSLAAVKQLEDRNKTLIKFFTPRLSGGSSTECTSLVLNGFSSNYNIQDSRKNELAILKRKIETYDAEPQALTSRACIVVSGDDGFFTNIDGIYGFFDRYKNVTLMLVVYHGENQYLEYEIRDILQAISEIKSHVAKPTDPCHTLVRSWIGIAVNKEILAQANRDLKRFIPQKRNASIVYGEDPIALERPDKSVLKASKKRSVVEKYGISINDDGDRMCPIQDCNASWPTLEGLRDHILDHCRQAGKCVLCGDDRKNPFNRESFRLPSGPMRRGFTKLQREHMERHLPPTYDCEEQGCSKSFHTESDYLQHQEGHEQSQLINCTQCGQSIRKTYVTQHLQAHCPARNKANDGLIRCGICQAEFSKVDMFHKHVRAAHQRRDEIVGTATLAGLFSAGLPGLGLDVSAAIEESTRLNASSMAIQHGNYFDTAQAPNEGRWKVNGKSVGHAVGFTN